MSGDEKARSKDKKILSNVLLEKKCARKSVIISILHKKEDIFWCNLCNFI